LRLQVQEIVKKNQFVGGRSISGSGRNIISNMSNQEGEFRAVPHSSSWPGGTRAGATRTKAE